MKHFDIDDLKVIAGPGCAETFKRSVENAINRLADRHSFRLTPWEDNRFRDGEILPQIRDNVRGTDVFIIQPTPPPLINEEYMKLFLQGAALASADSVTAVFPYMGGLRQDRKDRPRVAITAKVKLDQYGKAMISASRKHFVFFHPHFPQVQGFTDISSDILYPTKAFTDVLKLYLTDFSNVVTVAPDTGAAKLAEKYAEHLGTDFAVAFKRRNANDEVFIKHIIGDVKGKIAVVFDDIIDTAGTMCKLVDKLREYGVQEIFLCGTHGVLAGDAIKNLENSGVNRVIITNSINHENDSLPSELFTVVDCGELFGEAIWRTHTNQSISAIDGMYSLKAA